MSEIKERLQKYIDTAHISKREFCRKISVSPTFLANNSEISSDKVLNIVSAYPDISVDWLITGKEPMLKSDVESSDVQFYGPENIPAGRRLIPFYDDVASVGGANGIVANMDAAKAPTEYLDPGDWFKNATAAIRNYGESMREYPPGCILVLKEVYDRRLIIPGKDYVIETSEYRVTKRAHTSDSDCLHVRSTNDEEYQDGALIHPPFGIPWECIIKISEVLAHIVKKGSGTEVLFSNKKK